MTLRVAVVGAGVIGRMTAWRLARRGAAVTLFERRPAGDAGAASFVAAGMFAPHAESLHATADVAAAGRAALGAWDDVVAALPSPPLFRRQGTLVQALPGDEPELDEMEERLARSAPAAATRIAADAAGELEPALADLPRATLLIRDEGYVDTKACMDALARALTDERVTLRFGQDVLQVATGRVATRDETHAFDAIVDARGLGAVRADPQLRGVRGEVALVHAPELALDRPVRVLHPRYPIYVVPRPDRHYVIGATQLESASEAPVSIQSALELLGTAHAFHPAFRYASVVALQAQVRPAYLDNRPRLRVRRGVVTANGLYRHGWLLAPLVADAAAALALGEAASAAMTPFVDLTAKDEPCA